MSYQKFSLTILLAILVIVSFQASFTIYTITLANHNSNHIIQKVLDRLDQINNVTQREDQYTHNVQAFILEKIYEAVNKTGQ